MVILVSVLLILVVPIALVLVVILVFVLLVGIFFIVIILIGILFVIILVRVLLVVVVLLVIILVRGSSLCDDGQEDQGAHGDEWAHHDDPGRTTGEDVRRQRNQEHSSRRERLM